MLYIEHWKERLIVIICLLGVLYALPNALPKTTVNWLGEHMPSFLPHQTINLGLDLRGGSHLLLEVDLQAMMDERMRSYLQDVRATLRKAKIGYKTLTYKSGRVTFALVDIAQQDQAKEVIRELDRDMAISVDGDRFTLAMKSTQLDEMCQNAMEQSIEIVRRRIDETGTREPSIQKQGDDRILVQLPGMDDPSRVKNLLGQTAKLAFRLVERPDTNPMEPVPLHAERVPAAAEEAGIKSWIVDKRIMVSGDMLLKAQATFQNNEPVVAFTFDRRGAQAFGETTRENVGRAFAIVLDNKVISAPVIREPITGGSGVISGSFSTQSAQDLALLLRAGALPAPIKVIEERTIGPGLGADSVRAGGIAAVLGLVLVMISMVLFYRLFGLFANIALLINGALLFALLSFLQATLTLPGIAGIVLTIGMAVDANVLVFERIREEHKRGRSIIPAIDQGYKNAMSSITDANLTTLIAAVLLFIFGTGPVKGFAVTLSLGIITSVFCGTMVTHLIIIWWTQLKKPKKLPI
ncbi:MAG: protein translocase subunit SecD [Alphaproteobacteria bacterium]|nr:protein translocase subunit SecD [Alphaproteobacteria bacterium]